MSGHAKPSSPGVDQIENGDNSIEPVHISDAIARDHRANDDRADEARGRNADQFDAKYWTSVNFIGTMFAIGMAFMGGIGGKSTISCCL